MEALIAIAVACVAVAVAWAIRGRTNTQPAGSVVDRTRGRHDPAAAPGMAPLVGTRTGAAAQDDALAARRDEVLRLEERILQREESLEARIADLAGRERALSQALRGGRTA